MATRSRVPLGLILSAALVALLFAVGVVRRNGALWQRLDQFRTTLRSR